MTPLRPPLGAQLFLAAKQLLIAANLAQGS
jgi:hypothetical protein